MLECVPAQEATKRIAVKKGFHDCGISDGLAVYRLCRQKSKCGEQLIRADNSQVYDRQGYLDRVLSSSYSLQESDGAMQPIWRRFMRSLTVGQRTAGS